MVRQRGASGRPGFAGKPRHRRAISSIRAILFDRREQGGAAAKAGDPALAEKIRQFVSDQAGARPAGNQRGAGHQRNQISSTEKSKAMVMP